MTAPTYAEVDAGVRRAIAAYTQAVDDGRTDDVLATFLADGSVDIPGIGAHEGHEAMRTAYDAVAPRAPQRHLVVNTFITEWDATQATAKSDLVFMVHNGQEWMTFLTGRYTDTLKCVDGEWKFAHRTAEFAP
jgi:3-phenylpropionate/cinnamic acid dioxygenase small subunit